MTNRFFQKIKSRKGTTMLEVVAAVSILAIVVLAAVTAVNLSHSTVLSQGSSANAAAQAQSLADELITELHTKAPDKVPMAFDGAIFVDWDAFPDSGSLSNKQFTAKFITDGNGIEGYKIRTAVFYTDSNGRKCVQMQAFSAKDGG
jgi:type II secretory pathway pseudopilin PulG